MKIAVPCNNGRVAEHFGRCKKYIIFDIAGGKILRKESIASPEHRPNFLPKFLAERKIRKLICYGIGPKALNSFNEFGIEVIAGIEGKIDGVIESYNRGELKGGSSKCEHFE